MIVREDFLEVQRASETNFIASSAVGPRLPPRRETNLRRHKPSFASDFRDRRTRDSEAVEREVRKSGAPASDPEDRTIRISP